jgi:uncharacterized protein
MKKQVVVIHGGGSFIPHNGETMIEVIKNKKASLDDMRRHDNWKASLQDNLGDAYDVLAPRMPNADAPHYEEWKTWFEKIQPLLDTDAVFVGHSLGGMFLAKYFSEKEGEVRVPALFLVAPPYDGLGYGWELSDITPLNGRVGTIHIYHSSDDSVVPIEALGKYREVLEGAILHELDGHGHFRDDDFPELVADIKSL